MDDTDSALSLIKKLACCHTKTREKTVLVVVRKWLPSQSDISGEEMKKLWKGLFYCMWHADKPLAQSRLVESLCSLLPQLQTSLCVQYFSVFLLTMRREWTGIDGLRLDKFYLLIRRFMHYFFVTLKNNSWDLGISKGMMDVLINNTFLANDMFRGDGVNYHIASVFLDELIPFLPLHKGVVENILGPIVLVLGKVTDRVLLAKWKSHLFDELLKKGKEFVDAKILPMDVDPGLMVLATVALGLKFSSRFYDVGSSAECPQSNRKFLLQLHEEFLKIEKSLEASGLDVCFQEIFDGDGVVDNEEEQVTGCDEAAVSPNGDSIIDEVILDADVQTVNSPIEADLPTVDMGDVPKDGDDDDEKSICSMDQRVNETAISTLQKKFEEAAAEAGLDNDFSMDCDVIKSPINSIVLKKRKKGINLEMTQHGNDENGDEIVVEDGTVEKSIDKRLKKVKFSMKKNLIWKTQSPLPPQCLRLPPSVTPRGSALKKGVPPGPVMELPPATKKGKRILLKQRNKGSFTRLKKSKLLST